MNEIENLSDVLCDDQDLIIDQDWMEQLEAIFKRRVMVEQLVAKARENQGDVKAAIYERVMQDYQARLQTIESDLKPVAKHIHLELGEIEALESKIQAKLDLVEDELEEQTFRCKVGEFSEKDLAEKIESLSTLKEKLTHQISIAAATYEGCAVYLGDGWRTADLSLSQNDTIETSAIEVAAEPIVETPAAMSAIESVPEVAAVAPVAQEQTEVRASLAACLQLINAKGETQTFALPKDGLFIGKSTVNDVVIKKAGISRRHARVAWLDDGEYTVQDLSGRGISVNGQLTEQATIKHGDTITVGKVDLELIAQA